MFVFSFHTFCFLISFSKKRNIETMLTLSHSYNLSFEICTVLKILMCFSLIKCFPNDRKRYSRRLQVTILHQVAPIKVYLTSYENFKNGYLKKIFCATNKRFWLTSIHGLPYMKTKAL